MTRGMQLTLDRQSTVDPATRNIAPAPPAAASLSATMTMAPADLRTMQRATVYSVLYT